MAPMSTALRRLRPMRRSISMLRPLRLARSRWLRLPQEAGSIAYSAVIQPNPLPRRQGLTFSSMLTAHKTLVPPVSIRQLPAALSR